MDDNSHIILSKRQFLGGMGVTGLLVPFSGFLLDGAFIEPAEAAGFGSTPKFSLKQATRVINTFRAKHGRKPLKVQDQLQKAAVKHASLMAQKGKLAHSFGGSTNLRARVRAVGFEGRVAENIAAGQRSLAEVFAAWEKSSGHRRNMLNRNYTSFGLAVRSNSKALHGHYWAMVIGT